MQPREGLCIGFLGMSHLALSSSYRCSVLVSDLHGRTSVGWLSDCKDYVLTFHKNRAKIPLPYLRALNMVRRARCSNISAFDGTDIFVELTSCSIEFTDNMCSLEKSNGK